MAEYLLKGKIYLPGKSNFHNTLASEKIDGQRCFWDGGISRGLPSKAVPYCSEQSDSLCTGLYTQNGNIQYAPSWFIDSLPKCFLDGELDSEAGWNKTRSIVSRTVNLLDEEWHSITYKIFDSPSVAFFMDRRINKPSCKLKIDKSECMRFYESRKDSLIYKAGFGAFFINVYNRLLDLNIENDNLVILKQESISSEDDAMQLLDRVMKKPFAEGLIVRPAFDYYEPIRSSSVIKIKPRQDAEGTVIGYTEGTGKLSGMMGALIVKCNFAPYATFQLSGFSESERITALQSFPIGTIVTFSYREISPEGRPIEAAYLRKHQ